MSNSQFRMGMFAKWWQPGLVKTRLAAKLGAVSASELYREILQVMLDRLAAIEAQRVVVYAPDDAGSRRAFAQLIGPGWGLQPQAEGDLGARMHSFFQQSIDHGCQRVLLVGSDSPDLPLPYVRQAWQCLDTVPLVLGPSEDGGYYLIGVREQLPPIFHGIPWSTPRVWQQTIDRLQAVDYPFATLPCWYDVDQFEDLIRLHHALRGSDDPVYRTLRASIRHHLSDLGMER